MENIQRRQGSLMIFVRVRFVAIAKTKSRERKAEGRESRPYAGREQTDQLCRQIGKCVLER